MNEESKTMSLSAIGPDSPGLVSKITTRIYEAGGNLIDMEENCRRGLFYIFLIIDFSSSEKPMDEIIRELKDLEGPTALRITCTVHEQGEMPYPPEKEHHIVTILGMDHPGIIMRVSTFFHERNINIETCRMIAQGPFFSMEMVIDTSRIKTAKDQPRGEAIENMKAALKDLCSEIGQSVVIQSEDIYNKGKKLVVFDVESTLIRHDSLTHFLERINGRIKAINGKRAFGDKGEDRLQQLLEHARALKGIPLRELEKFGEALSLNPGTLDLIATLKSMGFKIALISSVFSFFLKNIFKEAGVDYAFSNMLEVDENGVITGELEEPTITPATKHEILQFILDVEKIGPEQVIGVGDGSSRSHFIKNAGLSIAFKPDKTSIKTDGFLSGDKIISLLYCLGIPKEELTRHLNPIVAKVEDAADPRHRG